jgi:phytoene synthase
MRINGLALSCLFGVSNTSGFSLQSIRPSKSVISQSRRIVPHASTQPYFADESTSSTSNDLRPSLSREITQEITSGRILSTDHDNKSTSTIYSGISDSVIDFGSVMNDSSRAEIALRKAKEEFLASPPTLLARGERLMGINDDVVREVGREIGAFAPAPEVIQRVGSYLRSQAPETLFQQLDDEVGFNSDDIKDYKSLLEQSYEESGIITEAFAKTFHLGTTLLPADAARSIWAIYVWCRRTDEIVDAPRENDDDMLKDLSKWEHRLERLFSHGEVEDVLDLALLDVRIKYPKLSIQPFLDMIRGMLMDIPELGVERYHNFEELHLYCYRVAGTVGLMSMPIFGCAEGYTEEIAKEPALSLGVAFQITNILRDVGEDATTRNRIYLPLSSLAQFNVTESQIYSKQIDDNYRNLMKHEIQRARQYYKKARTGVDMLSPYSRLPVQVSLDCYEKILDKIEENGYDSLTKRAYVSKWEKLFTVPFSWYRTQEISKTIPL